MGVRSVRADAKMTHEIARFFNVSVDDLCYTRLDKPSESTKPGRQGVVIKVYGRVAAGIPLKWSKMS